MPGILFSSGGIIGAGVTPPGTRPSLIDTWKTNDGINNHNLVYPASGVEAWMVALWVGVASSSSGATITPPTDFNHVSGSPFSFSVSGNHVDIAVTLKYLDGTEDGDTIAGSVSVFNMASILGVFQDVHPTDPIEGLVSGSSNNTSPVALLALTSTNLNRRGIQIFGCSDDPASGAPSGGTGATPSIAAQVGTSNGADRENCIFHYAMNAETSTGWASANSKTSSTVGKVAFCLRPTGS